MLADAVDKRTTKRLVKKVTSKRVGAARISLIQLQNWLTEYNNTVAPIQNYNELIVKYHDLFNEMNELQEQLDKI